MPSSSRPASKRQDLAGVTRSPLSSSPFAVAAHAGSLPIEAYAGLLRCLAVVYEAFELAAQGPARDALSSAPAGELRRLHLLNDDLDATAGRERPPIAEAELRAEVLAEQIRLWSTQHPAALRGVAAALGGPAIPLAVPPRVIAACFGFRGGPGTAFIAAAERGARQSSAPGTEPMALGEGETAAADQTAAALLAIVNALHPAGSRPLNQLARVLNPQAGNYLIPDDLGEIRAALRAGARTWSEIPYYGLRFADRGREWTWSDSCWLATLAKLEQKAVDAQIDWIGRLLGTRGMPQLLLEEHLYALAEELSAVRPAERGRYARLSVAAGRLAERRRAHIGDDDATAIAAAFDALELGGPVGAKLGAVLVAAVADEAAGVPQAVESVTAWAADPQRFPQAWIDAVHATIEAARAVARGRARG